MKVRTTRCLAGEAGFSIVESTIALAVVFSVVVALLATVTTGVRGVVFGRQRTGAVAVADEVMEQSRGRAYAEVGHDLDDDPTLTTDTSITGTMPNFSYNGEALAGSVLNGASNPPFTPHQWTTTRDATPYTVKVYVTTVTPAAGNGDGYKRITVKVSWAATQFSSAATSNQVKLSSFLFPATQPPDPRIDGVSESDGGSLTLTGSLRNVALQDAHLWFPYGHGEIQSHFIKVAKGYGQTVRSQINLTSGAATGCTLSNGNLTADCGGAKSDTFADNDVGTSPPDYDAETLTDGAHTVAAGTPLSFAFGSGGSAKAESAARSNAASSCSGILGNDLLPYHCSDIAGPASMTLAYKAGAVQGNLLSSSSAGSVTSLLDRTDSGGSSRLAVTSKATKPAIDLMTIAGGPSGFSGMVKLATCSVTATATSGPGAAAPTVTGAAFNVQLYSTSGTPGYTTVSITPGTTYDATSHAVFDVNSETITMDATLHSGPKVTTSTVDGGATTSAEASLTNWLWVEIHVTVVKDEDHTNDGDFTVHLDYGRLSSQATYAPA